ncbi:hypothetical protein [Solimicrobium silvestre]|uniref:Oxygen-regulated invasion protein OrgB n=1 Tax=Solimicrobium silvestre TaxID=2099400 RepID=A0A2S9H1Q2_9BURK|nr:hypothetical protein [Solimicrobium silvestre]PRC93880.1 hypothetical protein S2091_1489 [Solimicrobium silvestre]
MPKIIQTLCNVVPDEGVLVRSAYLRNNIKASALVAEARRRARSLVMQADDEAARSYREAKSEGYAAGILLAADALAGYLAGHAALAVQLQVQLQQQVGTLLERSVSNSDVVMAAFEECLSEQDLSAVHGLDLLLPDSMRARHQDLIERLQKHVHGQVNIEYQNDARFLLRLGDHVAEFAPDDFIARAGVRAMRNLSSIHAASSELSDQCRQRLAMLFSSSSESDRASGDQVERIFSEVHA